MALPEGTKLGPYEILSPIGAGGMGEVYRAQDTRLDRTVAIKVLPSHLSSDAELRRRFEREAKAVSGLNHPHICTVYDVGQQDGTDFLVMEYLEGETLATELTKGPLQTNQVLRYAIEISDALDKAHRQGVVHRDLKPGNIMLTKSGAKLLDFGLAKLRDTQSGTGEGVTGLPTENHSLTGAGTILGTFQYMSPEQLEGKDADARTDIFAFGAVVYEMATGRRAFEGESRASLIGAILKDDPPPISTLQPMAPAALDHIVKTCLAKDPNDRFQTARDLTLELQWIAEGGSRSPVTPPVVQLKKRQHLAWGVGVLLVAVVTAMVVWHLKPQPAEEPRPLTRFAITLPQKSPLVTTPVYRDLAISPDGSHIAYVAQRTEGDMQLYLRAVDQLEAIPIRGPEGQFIASPFFSPDGSQIGFFDPPDLKRVSIDGGVPVTVCTARTFGGASWGSDGAIIVGSSEGLFRVPAAGGEPQLLTTTDADKGEVAHGFPHILPGGNGVLFAIGTGDQFEKVELAVLDLKTKEFRLLVPGLSPHYSSTGHIVYGREETLWAVAFDSEGRAVKGEPVPLLENVARKHFGVVSFGLANNGSLVYIPINLQARELVWVNRNGATEPLPQDSKSFRTPRLSLDGQSVAVAIDDRPWSLDLRRNILEKPPVESISHPLLSPDTSQAVTNSLVGLYLVSTDGNGQPEQITLKGDPVFRGLTCWSPDGKFVVYIKNDPETGNDIWLVPMEGERKPRLFRGTKSDETQATVSPDSKWITYRSDHSGRNEIYVEPFPDGGPIVQISSQGGTEPVWAKNGRELFYRNQEEMMVVGIETKPEFKPGTPDSCSGGRTT